MQDEAFEDILKPFDILCLQETHTSQQEPFRTPENFVAIPHCRGISTNSRYFGGMLLLIRKQIRKGVKINHKFDVDSLPITLDRNFFGIDQNINILFTYASPITSCYTNSRSENILEKIEHKIEDGRNTCLVIGDLNGRTKRDDDFVRDSADKHSPINVPFYTKDTGIERNNQDIHAIDAQGKLILDLCKSTSLRILNGRTNGDINGKSTRYPKRINERPSVIDYALCGEALLPKIFSFSVLPFTSLSDHCCISTNIRINNRKSNTEETPETTIKVNPDEPKLTYDNRRKHIFQANVLTSDKLDTLLTILNKREHSEMDLHLCITRLNDVILDAAKRTFPVKKTPNKIPKRNNTANRKSKAWFSKECMKLRKLLRKHSRDLSSSPFDRQKLSRYLKVKNEYKRTCRKAEQKSRQLLTKKLMNIGINDPQNFWTIINKMNSWGKDKIEETEHIKPHTWNEYFKKLLNKPSCPPNNTQTNTTPTFDPMLDGIITLQEVLKALQAMKNNKAPGPDKILVEYLKAFGEPFAGILVKIIRKLFAQNVYPPQWNSNYLKPIFKKDDKEDPDNYRGLAIGSALAKLFSMILLNRLLKYIHKFKLISANQIGFMKGSRTSDHIFLLQTIIEKVVKKNKKKLYTAFIDFKKAYDTVDRDKLFKRLQALEINGPFLKNIMALYEKPSYKIKLNKGYLDPIRSNLGLKQGCPLSPILFNLYIDDVKDAFDNHCDPIKIQDEKLYHFLYADDLVLLSNSAQGLQRSLDKLADYADKRSLTISIKKSKTMIFNLQGRLLKEKFNIKGESLEPVKTFCYLGFEMTPSGTVRHAMNILNEKAKKALKPLLNVIAKFDLSSKLAIRLFHTYISPIILYNVENWTILTDKKIQTFTEKSLFDDTNESKADVVHRNLLKYILGLSKSTPNMAIYGETGEIPLSFKGYRLMLNYWKRLTCLPEDSLARKALTESVNLRTNWIKTIEKLLLTFNLIEVDETQFTDKTKIGIYEYYINSWKNKLANEEIPRMNVYKVINSNFDTHKHLELPYKLRKVISKIRCSNHALEIEKGRHTRPKTPREARLCKICENGEVEDETHFLLYCEVYQNLRETYDIHFDNIYDLLNTNEQIQLANYLTSTVQLRERLLNGRGRE